MVPQFCAKSFGRIGDPVGAVAALTRLLGEQLRVLGLEHPESRAMGVTQARVSRIEKGQLERSEVDALAAYVKALGGKLKSVADFGDETYVLG